MSNSFGGIHVQVAWLPLDSSWLAWYRLWFRNGLHVNFGVWGLCVLPGQDLLCANNLRVSVPFLSQRTSLPLKIGGVGAVRGGGFGLLWCTRLLLCD